MKEEYNKRGCYLCENNTFVKVFDRDRNDETLNNYSCTNCGFVMVLPRLSMDEQTKLYKEGNFSKVARGSKKPASSKIRSVESTAWLYYQHLTETLSLEKIQSLKNSLEIGCGAGSFLRLLKISGLDVKGIEPDLNMAQYGIDQYELDIETGFFEDVVLESKYDLISSFHVIEHIENPTLFVRKVYESLQQGGLFYLECPTLDNMYGTDEKFFFWKPHINSFSDVTIRFLLEKEGFEVLNLTYLRGFVNVIAIKREKDFQLNLITDSPKRIKDIIKLKINNSSGAYKVNKSLKYKLYSYKKKLERNLKGNKKKIFSKSKKDVHSSKYKLAHIGFHNSTNAGDIALFESVRKQYEYYLGDVEFKLFELHNRVSERLIAKLNTYDGIIIGGGGLFLKDTNENDISGWQWPIPKELYAKIEIPLFVHAVGYNRFRDQGEFIAEFNLNLNELVNASSFIGLRNSGSIQSIQNYLGPGLKSKICFQPCPTTMLDILYRDEIENINKNIVKAGKKKIAVNIAFDRHNLRYGRQSEENDIMNTLCDAIIELKRQDFEIINLVHVPRDEEFNLWLRKKNIKIEVINLVGASIDKIIEVYKQFDLVIGTRGHAQMIPFGLDISILSLVSHDKLIYFLNDINENGRAIEIKSNRLKSELLSKVQEYSGKKSYEYSKANLCNQTEDNFKIIKSSLND